MVKLKHFFVWLCILLCCLAATAQTPVATDTPDSEAQNPVVWRYPLDSGFNSRLYMLDDNILVYEEGGNAKLISLEGVLVMEWHDEFTYGINSDESCGIDRRWVENRKFWLTREGKPANIIPQAYAITGLTVTDFLGLVIAEYPVETPRYSRGFDYISDDYLIIEGKSEPTDLPPDVWLAQIITRDGQLCGAFEVYQESPPGTRVISSYLQMGNAIVYSDSRGIHCVSEDGTTLWDNSDVNLAFSKLYKFPNGDICAFAYANGFLARVNGKGEILWKTKIGQMDRRWESETPPHAMDKQGRFYYAAARCCRLSTRTDRLPGNILGKL